MRGIPEKIASAVLVAMLTMGPAFALDLREVRVLYVDSMGEDHGARAFTEVLREKLIDYGFVLTNNRQQADAWLTGVYHSHLQEKADDLAKDPYALHHEHTVQVRIPEKKSNRAKVQLKSPEGRTIWSYEDTGLFMPWLARGVARKLKKDREEATHGGLNDTMNAGPENGTGIRAWIKDWF